MQQSIVKFIALSYRYCSTCFGHYNAHHQEPVKLPLQSLVSAWMWRWKCSQPWPVKIKKKKVCVWLSIYVRACVSYIQAYPTAIWRPCFVCVCVCVHAHIQSSSDGLMQGRLVIPYRRSGTTYRSHFEGSSTPTTQKSTDLICTEAEAWSHAQLQPIRNFSARRGWVVSTTPQPLYPRGKTRYPMCMCVCVCVCMYVCVCIYIYIYMYIETER